MSKLYKVVDEALSEWSNFKNDNREAVAKHGYIWVCEGAPMYKSLVTGELYGWLTSELEELG